MFDSIVSEAITPLSFTLCTLAALAVGIIISLGYMYKNRFTQSFVISLALLPAIVEVIIMMVNGSVGTGVAIAGTFSLVRFRSVPGSAKEILGVFLAMATGLACGMGYVLLAITFALLIMLINILLVTVKYGSAKEEEKQLRIVIPENLDYTGMFDEVFEKYTSHCELIRAKTTAMGSLFNLTYYIRMKSPEMEKQMIDELRVRNGNLEICCGRIENVQQSEL